MINTKNVDLLLYMHELNYCKITWNLKMFLWFIIQHLHANFNVILLTIFFPNYIIWISHESTFVQESSSSCLLIFFHSEKFSLFATTWWLCSTACIWYLVMHFLWQYVFIFYKLYLGFLTRYRRNFLQDIFLILCEHLTSYTEMSNWNV